MIFQCLQLLDYKDNTHMDILTFNMFNQDVNSCPRIQRVCYSQKK